jgi:hypothetical protein
LKFLIARIKGTSASRLGWTAYFVAHRHALNFKTRADKILKFKKFHAAPFKILNIDNPAVSHGD